MRKQASILPRKNNARITLSQREQFSDWKDGGGAARWGRGSLAVLLLAEQRREWSLMIFCARATRGR